MRTVITPGELNTLTLRELQTLEQTMRQQLRGLLPASPEYQAVWASLATIRYAIRTRPRNTPYPGL
jgi:hypothetical protein